MPPENLRKLAHPELEISTVNIISVKKWGNEHTDRQTRNLNFFEKLKKIAHLQLEIAKDNLISVRK